MNFEDKYNSAINKLSENTYLLYRSSTIRLFTGPERGVIKKRYIGSTPVYGDAGLIDPTPLLVNRLRPSHIDLVGSEVKTSITIDKPHGRFPEHIDHLMSVPGEKNSEFFKERLDSSGIDLLITEERSRKAIESLRGKSTTLEEARWILKYLRK